MSITRSSRLSSKMPGKYSSAQGISCTPTNSQSSKSALLPIKTIRDDAITGFDESSESLHVTQQRHRYLLKGTTGGRGMGFWTVVTQVKMMQLGIALLQPAIT